MTPAALLAELTAAGFRLRAEAGRLLVSPASNLTTEQRALVAQHRDALLALVEVAVGPFEEGTLGHWPTQASQAIEAWNNWERDHPALTAAGKPRKKRTRKKPIDTLALVRVPRLETLGPWDDAARRRAVQDAEERERRERERLVGLDGAASSHGGGG